MSTMTTVELTPEVRAKRVAIARDVIERIEMGKLQLTTKSYFNPSVVIDHLLTKLSRENNKNLHNYVDQIEPYCEVCQKGAMLFSMARLDKEPMRYCPFEAIATFQDPSDYGLNDVFDQSMLDRIECAFEQDAMFGSAQDTPSQVRDSVAFGRRFDNSADRCRAVMENIIANDGEFLPSATGDSV